MKNIFKNTLKLMLICFLFALSSCEKDIYENSIQNTSKHKMRRVTIDDVPFLKPTLEKYNPNYRYLSNSNAVVSNKDASDLNLELDHIIEYITANGLKSYSIPIKNEFGSDKEDYYFENLHVLQIDGDYKAFIAKYNQTDDSKKFETPTFTGKIELLDIDQTPIDSVAFFNGQKMAEPAPPTPPNPDEDEPSGATGDADPHTHGWVWHFIHWLIGDPEWNGIKDVATDSGGSDSSSSSGESEPDYSGVIVIFDPGGPTSSNPTQNNPSGGSIVIVPNQPSWPEFMNNLHMRANLICQRLEIDDITIRNWLATISNATLSNDIYNYLLENTLTTNYYKANAIAKQIIISIKSGGEADLAFKVIIDSSLKNNPCLFGVYTQLGKAPTFQNYLHSFDGDFSVANLKLDVGVNSFFPTANAVTSPPQNYMIEIMFNPNNLHRPQLDIARTFIHELIHAEIYRKLLSLAGQPNIQWSVAFINSIKDDFPGLYDYYMRYTFNVPSGEQPSDAQHQLMAQHYRDIIIQVMQQFDNSHTPAFYNALSWSGLMGTGVVNSSTGLPPSPTVAWSNTPLAERLQIISTINSFNTTNPPCQP